MGFLLTCQTGSKISVAYSRICLIISLNEPWGRASSNEHLEEFEVIKMTEKKERSVYGSHFGGDVEFERALAIMLEDLEEDVNVL